MNNLSVAAAIAFGLSATNKMPTIRMPNGSTCKVYPEDQEKIAANHATAGERQRWNEAVDVAKEVKLWANRRSFVPRKASHKQG